MLYNPFYPWTKDLMLAQIAAGHSFFVRQSFARGKANAPKEIKHVLQMFHYPDFAYADQHLQHIKKTDPYASLYDVNKPDEKEKLLKSTDHFEGIQIFSNTLYPDWKQKLKSYERMFRSYIENTIGWHPKGKEKVLITLHSQNGSMYVTFKYGSDKARFLFDQLEKPPVCATTSPYSLISNWLPTTYQP